jgi:4,5-DOPA dioxygenase extradiol
MFECMPVVFVSHGAPDALLKAPDAVECWRKIGQQIPTPKSILVVSAHWETQQASVSLARMPDTIHDFSGFSPELYDMHYSAPGAPDLAEQVASLLSAAGISATLTPNRGLDHGAWVPLSAMYPQANIPVTQLSVPSNTSPAALVDLGRAIVPLRHEGVLIVASGAITHNFSWLDWEADANEIPFPKAKAFTEWVAEQIGAQDSSTLLKYRSAPYGKESHPTEEHFLPIFVALGAANGDQPKRYSPKFAYGGLAMDAYLWGNRTGKNHQENVNG